MAGRKEKRQRKKKKEKRKKKCQLIQFFINLTEMNGSTVSQVSKVNGSVKMRGMESLYFKNLCINEPKRTKRTYQSLAENVRGKNEPFPLNLSGYMSKLTKWA